jgi:hypothetical protein
VRRKGWTPTNASHLCSAHFTDNYFNRTGQTIRLLQGSLPTVFNFPAHLQPGPAAPRKPPVLRDLGNIPSQSAKDYKTSCENASLNVKLDHCYASSPHKLKRQISYISEKLDENRQTLRLAQQKIRRLSNQLSSKVDVIAELEKSHLVSNNCLDVLKSCFSGPNLQLIVRQLAQHKESGIVLNDNAYDSELHAFVIVTVLWQWWYEWTRYPM